MNSIETYAHDVDRGLRRSPCSGVVGDPQVRGRLVRALDAAGIEVCACAGTPDGLVAEDRGLDLIVLHETGEATARLESVRKTREALPEPILVVVWPPADQGNARRALRAGADGLVSEAELEATLAATIQAVRSGLVCIPRKMRAPLESESLSMREKQVLGMLVMGFSNAEIAARLYLAESTIKSHLSSAYTKLGVRSRKDAATMILDPTEGLGPGILAISAA